VTSRQQTSFISRVEDELRRRRELELERCLGCGKKINRRADYQRVRNGLMHASCIDQPVVLAPSLGAAPL
jgi:hypothetical protein